MARRKLVSGRENAAAAAAAWAAGMAAGQKNYADGVANSQVDWAGRTVAAKSQWQAGLTAAFAAGTWEQGISQAGTAGWKTGVRTKGVQRFAAAGATGQPHYLAWLQAWMQVLPAELQALNNQNPRGTLEQNIARSAAFIRWEHSQKGKFKKVWRNANLG